MASTSCLHHVHPQCLQPIAEGRQLNDNVPCLRGIQSESVPVIIGENSYCAQLARQDAQEPDRFWNLRPCFPATEAFNANSCGLAEGSWHFHPDYPHLYVLLQTGPCRYEDAVSHGLCDHPPMSVWREYQAKLQEQKHEVIARRLGHRQFCHPSPKSALRQFPSHASSASCSSASGSRCFNLI